MVIALPWPVSLDAGRYHKHSWNPAQPPTGQHRPTVVDDIFVGHWTTLKPQLTPGLVPTLWLAEEAGAVHARHESSHDAAHKKEA